MRSGGGVSVYHSEMPGTLKRTTRENKQSLYWIVDQALGAALQLFYFTAIVIVAGWVASVAALGAAVMGFLLLETVNYIEHYGLVRRKLSSGHFETVEAMHSWNSNHELGRIFLYELTRHADHHYRTNRHYQILRHLEGAPQLPMGYPGSMILSLLPSMWRKIMDQRISDQENKVKI
jgi:alkane 1-monooxygenase